MINLRLYKTHSLKDCCDISTQVNIGFTCVRSIYLFVRILCRAIELSIFIYFYTFFYKLKVKVSLVLGAH